MPVPTGDNWVAEHDSIDECGYEIMHKITQRNTFQRNSIAFSRSDVQVHQMIKNYKERVTKLSEQLMRLSNSLTQKEAERRQRLIDNLNYRYEQMEYAINNPDNAGRSALLGNQTHSWYGASSSSAIPSSWNDDIETNAARNLNAEEMIQKQKTLLQEQDKGLDSLGEIITRQKYMAQGISSEIDLQNEIIDDIGDAMDQTNTRLERNTRNIKVVNRKSGTCCYWIIIILLFIGILLALFV